MSQHQPKRRVDPPAWRAVLLLALAMVLAIAFTERATIARSLHPTDWFATLAPTAVDLRLSGSFDASRGTGPAIGSTISRHPAAHAPHLDEPFARNPSLSDQFVRPVVGDPRQMLSDMADQSRPGYPAFLGPCPCPVGEQRGPHATE
jgi:hypothetical protein